MNDLDDRLAALNPVRAEDVRHAAASADAARLLHRILNQPAGSPPPRRAYRSRWTARGWIAAAAAAVVIAALAATLPGAGRHANAPAGVAGFQGGPSVGVAGNAVQLVDYAARSAALAPAFVPGPRDWTYFETYFGPTATNGPGDVGTSQTWQQVGTLGNASSWDHGTITYGVGGGPGAQLNGWPGLNFTTLYQYLASLPAQPGALRKIILANNNGDPAAAFTAIEDLFGNFAMPARLQAELYAVLVSLPGVSFAQQAVDAAGRAGVGLYIVHDGFIQAGVNKTRKVTEVEGVVVNARTYVYMGTWLIAVRGQLSPGTLLAHPGSGTIVESAAILNSGIVSQPGQVPAANGSRS